MSNNPLNCRFCGGALDEKSEGEFHNLNCRAEYEGLMSRLKSKPGFHFVTQTQLKKVAAKKKARDAKKKTKTATKKTSKRQTKKKVS